MIEQTQKLHITSGGSSLTIGQELCNYRQLIYFFTWREFKVRYKQTALGMIWVGLQPLVFMGVIQLIMLRRGKVNFSYDAPAWILVFLGFVIWQFFEGSFSGTIHSFVNNQNLFRKVYFPKFIPAVAFVLSRLIDLLIGILLMLFLSLLFDVNVHLLGFYLLIPANLIVGLSALGAGLFVGTLNVKYRDVGRILPFFIRICFLSTPTFWPLTHLPEWVQTIMYLNPATASIEILRGGFFDPNAIHWSWLWMPLVAMTSFLIIGAWYFKKQEKEIVDIV